jgi:ribokinase
MPPKKPSSFDAARIGSFDAAGIGVVTRDLTVLLDAHPPPDTKLSARGFAETGGGPVPTALVTLARLGARTAFLGVVGDDAAGRFLVEDLRGEGIDTTGVVVRRGFTTPVSLIVVGKDGARTVMEYGQKKLPYDKKDAVSAAPILEACRMLLLDARMPAAQEEAARRARAGGASVMLDCGHPRPGVKEILPLCDVAIFSHSYALAERGEELEDAAFLGDLAARLHPEGAGIAGLTLGAAGCVVVKGTGPPLRIRGHAVEAIDTTGAGDVFHGAFAWALLRGESHEAAAAFANAAAATKCRALSGRAPIATEAEIRALAGLSRRRPG